MSNEKLKRAIQLKNDEYYTRLGTIESELSHYWGYLRGKKVYCPCDSESSNFVKYFKAHFDEIGLSGLLYSCMTPLEYVKLHNYDGKEEVILEGTTNGSCLDSFAWDIMLQDDIVVITNPPFSLWRAFLCMLMDAKTDFIILGGAVNLHYKVAQSYYMDGRLHIGFDFNCPVMYDTPQGERGVNSGWYTSFDVDKTGLPFYRSGVLWESVKASADFYDFGGYLYLKKSKDLPDDYTEPFCAPLSFMAKVNPLQFKVLGFIANHSTVNGSVKFSRVILQRLERNDDNGNI